MNGRLLQLWQNLTGPAPAWSDVIFSGSFVACIATIIAHITWWENPVNFMVSVQGQADLFEIVEALGPAGSLTGGLYSRQ